MKRSLWLPIRLALCFSVLSLCPVAAYGEGPPGLHDITTLEGAREKLFGMRDSNALPGGQQEMMDLARNPELEHKLRGKPLGELMEGVSYKETGSPPAQSRGLMSDIDRTVSTLDDFEKIKKRALDLGYKIDATDFRIKIEGLDTVIWKPGGKSAALADRRTSLAERARILAADPEFALEAGRKAGAHPLMSVAENLTKGQEALLGDLSKLPPWKAELELVAGAKDVLRSLNAANMCAGEMKSVCAELEAVKSMKKPPGNLLQKQKELRGLMGNAFEKSQMLLDMEMDSLLRRMQDAVDPEEVAHLQGRVAELRGQMTEEVERFRMLEEKFPHEMRQMSGGKSAAQIRDEMIRRGVKLEEGRRKLEAGRAADDRARERARKVEKISYVVDALQFVECLHQEGKDVTSCLKEAAQGLVMAEALAKGTYVISLVSETGAVIVSGTVAVAGLGASMYFTGAKLGEAAYEASEYWEARQKANAAVAGMEEAQQARVQNLAQQLEKLEAQVKRFIAETEARQKQILADLDKYEQLAGTMKEAKAYRDRQGVRLDTIQAALAKAAPPCHEIQGIGASLKRSLGQTRAAAQQIEVLLLGAQKSARECGDQEALDRGNGSYQEAENLVRQNREMMKSLEIDRRNLTQARTDFQAALREAGGEGKLDEAREIFGRLEIYAAEAEANLVDIVGISDRVAAIANEIEAKKSGFKGEIKNFKYAFPEHLSREWVEKYGFPQEMATAWLARLDRLEKTVAALQPMGDGAWREKWTTVMTGNPGLGREAKLFIQEIRQRGPRLKGMADTVAACLPGDSGTGATAKDIDDIDMQQTLSNLAFDKLGRGYLDLRTACTQKLGGRPAAPLAGPAPAGVKKETLFVLQEGYPQVNPDKAELKNITVDPSGLTAELREKNDRRWGRSECDQQVRFTFGRPPSILKPEEVFEITFLGKWTGEEKKLCESYGMAVSVNPIGKNMPSEGSSTVGLVRRLGERGNYIVSSNREARMTFKHAAPLEGGIGRMGGIEDNVLEVDLILDTGRLGTFSVVRYRYEEKDVTPDEARRLLASRAAGTPPAPAESPAGRRPEDARPETLAAGLLLLEMLTGDVTIYFGSPAEAQPLKSAGQIKPGAMVQAGQGAQAAIKTPGGASVRIGENSKVKMAGQEPASRKQVVEVLDGTVEVNRKETLPGFDDVKIRTRDSQAWATQTRYKVRVTDRGTTYEVMEGTIHITGQMLAKTNADFQVVGKYAFQKEMDLHAGEKAISFTVSFGQSAASPPSKMPSWATGGGTATAPADGLSGPQSPQWNDPKVQALMDEWLRTATPTVAAERPGQWRFSEWGQVLGPGSTAAGAPDHPAGWSRHQSLWAVRDKFDSLNLCTMGQYIERRLKGETLAGCAKPGGAGQAPAKPGVPAWLSPAGASPGQGSGPGTEQPLVKQSEDAISRARQQLAAQKQDDQRRKEEEAGRVAQKQRAVEERQRSEQQRLAEERLRAEQERRQAQAEAERARQKVQSPDFAGDWKCTIEEGFSGRTSPANFSIVKQGAAYVLVTHTEAGDDRSKPALANGSTVTFVREFSRVTMTLTLRLDGDRLTGIDHIDRDNGTTNDYPITCVR